MCHFCHNMQYNPSAPDHRSARCRDRSNTYSQIPMEKRMYDRGQRIVNVAMPTPQPTPTVNDPTGR
jgi:hypothetical protein